jgi:hypothetical protein
MKKSEMNPITEMALSFLCKRRPSVGPYAEENMPQYQWVDILMDFLDKKGEEALQALAGFYCYMIDNQSERGEDKTSRDIAVTFSHDLGERNDTWSLPRSSGPGYLEYWLKEAERIPQRMTGGGNDPDAIK